METEEETIEKLCELMVRVAIYLFMVIFASRKKRKEIVC